MTPGALSLEVVEVDAGGIVLKGGGDAILDVCFDGRRIWSFRSVRDSEVLNRHESRVNWPPRLSPRLRGWCRVSVMVHGADESLFDERVEFDGSDSHLQLVNAQGEALGLDNDGKLVPTFETRSARDTGPMLDSVETVLKALADLGIAAFPAYGTLLGAVRDGRLIGHDSDTDLGYVSRYSQPYDVIRESFRIQRALHHDGFQSMRLSGASFKVLVTESDGFKRGLDVFGGYHDGQRFNLLGEIRQPFKREWLLPLGTTTLEGRTLPAPADPERVLEATYGPGWRHPDPAFVYETPPATVRAFSGFFRASRARRKSWSQVLTGADPRRGTTAPSPLAEHVVAAEGLPARVFDVGAGLGIDSVWFAKQGSEVTAYDYILTAVLRRKEANMARRDNTLEVRRLNLVEYRSFLAEGARAARLDGPVTIVANHVLDAMPAFGRDGFARFASMAARQGGRVYADFWCGGGPERQGYPLKPVAIAEVVGRLQAQGAKIVTATEVAQEQQAEIGRRTGRVVAQWT